MYFLVLCNDCAPKSFGESSIVCICNSTYCDTLNLNPDGIPKGSYVMYTSSKDGLRFDSQTQKFSVAEGNSGKLAKFLPSLCGKIKEQLWVKTEL